MNSLEIGLLLGEYSSKFSLPGLLDLQLRIQDLLLSLQFMQDPIGLTILLLPFPILFEADREPPTQL